MRLRLIRFAMVIGLLVWAQSAASVLGTLHNNLPKGSLRTIDRTFRTLKATQPAAAWQQDAASQAPSTEKTEPLTKDQLMELIAGGVPNERATELIRDRGIDFEVDDDYVRQLQKAGANSALIQELRKASVTLGGLLIETAPNAQVFVDGSSKGQADAQGVMTLRAKLGPHNLKISLAGKQDFEQNVTIAKGPPTRVVAQLADVGGSARMKGPAGAAVWLDDSSQGTIDASGELLLSSIAPGTHALRVTAKGKVDDLQSITVTAGAETSVQVALADGVRTNPQDALQYVWIAPGNFQMGCSPGDNDCAAPEKPAHAVTISKAFWIGQTEVTVGAYKRYADATKTAMPPAAPKTDRGWKRVTFPIVDVTWDEAGRYCAWAGGRLPTEGEWEFAARGGDPQARYGELNSIAWSKDNAGNETHSVGGKLPNPYGLLDMLGNVWEWVNDWYDPNYYASSPANDPTGPAQDPTGPATGTERVLRGGSWIVDAKLLRASDRYSIKPDARSDYFGFRCVWAPKTP